MTQSALKPKATTKAPTSKKRPHHNSEEDVSENDANKFDGSVLSSTPPKVAKKMKKAPASKKSGAKPLADVANESFSMDGAGESAPGKETGASEKYQKVGISVIPFSPLLF